jgi:kinesin family protein 18/19
LREDSVKGICVAGVLEIMTTNPQEIMSYILKGNQARTKERTDANEASSRSHAVLQVTVEHKDKAHGTSAEINIAKLSLIDLAGSERASNTNNRGARLIEGANINRSLLALGNCINALCEA